MVIKLMKLIRISVQVPLAFVLLSIFPQWSFAEECDATLSEIKSVVAQVDEGLSAQAQQRIVEVEHTDSAGNTFGSRFSQIGWPTVPTDFPAEVLDSVFREGAHVTEVAAGSGVFLNVLNRERENRRISSMTFVGTDILPPKVSLDSNVSLVQDDLFNSSLEQNVSDGVFAIYTPLQAPLPASFIQAALISMTQRTKPEGFVVIFPLARENLKVAQEIAPTIGLKFAWSKDLYPERNHGPALIFQRSKL